ncbi:Equilibrative nucleotide transporter 3, partial [Linum grandiflorum]
EVQSFAGALDSWVRVAGFVEQYADDWRLLLQLVPELPPFRVLTLVYQPFALGTTAILAYHESKIDTRKRNIAGYLLFFVGTMMLLVKYHPLRVLIMVYQPFALGTMSTLAYNESKIDTRPWKVVRLDIYCITVIVEHLESSMLIGS